MLFLGPFFQYLWELTCHLIYSPRISFTVFSCARLFDFFIEAVNIQFILNRGEMIPYGFYPRRFEYFRMVSLRVNLRRLVFAKLNRKYVAMKCVRLFVIWTFIIIIFEREIDNSSATIQNQARKDAISTRSIIVVCV